MRIMAKKVGFHKMVGNEAGIFGRATRSFEELVADQAQRIWFESRHQTPFVRQVHKLLPGRIRESASRQLLSKAPAASSCGKTDGGNILNETSCAEHLHTIQDARWPVVRKKNFRNEIGRSAPTLVISKAENVDPSDSSIPLTGIFMGGWEWIGLHNVRRVYA